MQFYRYLAHIALFITAMRATPVAGGDVHINDIRDLTMERRQLYHNGTVYCSEACGWPNHDHCTKALANIYSSIGTTNCPQQEYSQSITGYCGLSYEMESGQGCIDMYYFYLAAQEIYNKCSTNPLTGFSGGCYLYEQSIGGSVGSVVCMWAWLQECWSGDI